jgi:hypothetical protein
MNQFVFDTVICSLLGQFKGEQYNFMQQFIFYFRFNYYSACIPIIVVFNFEIGVAGRSISHNQTTKIKKEKWKRNYKTRLQLLPARAAE